MNEETYEDLSVESLIYYLWKNRWVVICFTIAGILLSGFMYGIDTFQNRGKTFHQIYTSVSVVSKFEDGTYTLNRNKPTIEDLHAAQDMTDAVAFLVSSHDFLNEVLQRAGYTSIAVADVQKALKITRLPDSQVVEIQLTWLHKREGIAILDAAMELFPEKVINSIDMGHVNVIDMPYCKSSQRVGVNKIRILISFFGCFIFGIAYCVCNMLGKQFVLSKSDIQISLGKEVIGEIPHEDSLYKGTTGNLLESEENVLSKAYIEGIAITAHLLLKRMQETNKNIFFFTSCLEAEGKSMISFQMAMSLRKLEKKVLLIDMDMRKPSLGKYLMKKTDSKRTLNAVNRNKISIKDAVYHLKSNLDFLPAIVEKERLTQNEKLLSKINEVAKEYDVVLLDLSPVGLYADVLSCQSLNAEAIFVVQQGESDVKLLADNVEKLEKIQIPVYGFILNNIQYKLPFNSYFTAKFGKGYYKNREKIKKRSKKIEEQKAKEQKKNGKS